MSTISDAKTASELLAVLGYSGYGETFSKQVLLHKARTGVSVPHAIDVVQQAWNALPLSIVEPSPYTVERLIQKLNDERMI